MNHAVSSDLKRVSESLKHKKKNIPQSAPVDSIPGDLTSQQVVERFIRVDHAGEYGAVRIYKGQLAVLSGRSAAIVRHMYDQEVIHCAYFQKKIAERQVRPTALQPLWHIAGWALGAGTALLGQRAAMACTVAVEEAIDEHYAHQINQLGDDEADLRRTLAQFREEELEHRDTGYENGARHAPAYTVLHGAIKAGTRFAIWLSERV